LFVSFAAHHAQRITSRAEVLAAASATRAQDLATTRGSLTREETVATGAHEVRGLECPLHRIVLTKEFGSAADTSESRQQKGPLLPATAYRAARLSETAPLVKIK
jgi:hypothetical protein